MKTLTHKISILLLLLGFSVYIHAQSPEILAKAAFLKAQELYGNGDYITAIEKLNDTKNYLGGSNPRIDHLLTVCYVQTKNIEGAKLSIKSYFEQAADNDANYMEMLGLIEKVNNLESEALILQRENDAWNTAVKLNTKEAYQDYLKKYPSGKFAAVARDKTLESVSYEGKIMTRSKDLPARLGPGEYSYVIGSPDQMLSDGVIQLTFQRGTRFYGSALKLRIFVNDIEYTKVGNGETKTITVPAGKLVIYTNTGGFDGQSKILLYPINREEKFYIELRGAISEYLQHSSTYTPDTTPEEKTPALMERKF